VSPGAADEGRGGMTGRAIQAGQNVIRWGPVIHAGCNGTIVAGITVSTHNVRARVVDRSREETTGGMADTAILVGR